MPGKRVKRTTSDSLFPETDAEPSQLSPLPELPKSWAEALSAEFGKPYFAELMRFVAKERAEYEVLPPEPDVYNAFRYTPLDEVRVVILGQDPYPTPGHAHGLCFSVRPGVALPGSLRNIYKELNSDLGIPPARHGYLAAWAKRGVFLLNTVLTVRAGKPASHAKKGWETFTDAVIQALSDKQDPVVFVLWGGYAQKKGKLIDGSRHRVIMGAHPSPLSQKKFFGTKPFSQVNEALREFGKPEIDWQIPNV